MAIPMVARLTVLVGVCVLEGVVATAVGQQELLRRKSQPRAGAIHRPGIGPGEGPSSGVLYMEVHWEFWWYLNRESLVQLRQRLRGDAAALGDDGEWSRGGRRIPEADLPGVAEALARAARESDPGLQAAALMALAKTGLPEYAPLLEEAAEEGRAQVRRTATLALGILQSPGSAAQLEALILDEDQPAEICRYAAVGLALSGGLESRQAFLRLLEPKFFTGLDRAKAQGLALGVGITHEPALSTPVKQLLRGRPELDPATRAFLVLSLGRLGAASSRELLETYLDDESPLVRRSAALGLGALLEQSANQTAVDKLFRRLVVENESTTRLFLLLAMGRIGGPAAAEALGRMVVTGRDATRGDYRYPGNSSAPEQNFAALALGMMHTPDMPLPEHLIPVFATADHHITRGALGLALGLCGNPEGRAALYRRFHREGDPRLQGHLGMALGLLGDTRASGVLLRALRERVDIELIPNAAIALTLMGERSAALAAIHRRLSVKARLGHETRSLLYALGRIGDQTSVPLLQAILESPRQPAEVRRYAAVALGDLADDRMQRAMTAVTTAFNYTIDPHLLTTLLIEL